MNLLEMRKALKNPEVKDLYDKTKGIEQLKKEAAKTQDLEKKVNLLETCLELTEYVSKEYLLRTKIMHEDLTQKVSELTKEVLTYKKTIRKLKKK